MGSEHKWRTWTTWAASWQGRMEGSTSSSSSSSPSSSSSSSRGLPRHATQWAANTVAVCSCYGLAWAMGWEHKSGSVLLAACMHWTTLAEVVQNHVHSLCSLLLQEGLHVFNFVSAATALNVLHSQTLQIRLSWHRAVALPALMMRLWSRRKPWWVSLVFLDESQTSLIRAQNFSEFSQHLSRINREVFRVLRSQRWFWWFWSSSAPAVAPTYLAYWIASKPTQPAAAWIKTSYKLISSKMCEWRDWIMGYSWVVWPGTTSCGTHLTCVFFCSQLWPNNKGNILIWRCPKGLRI